MDDDTRRQEREARRAALRETIAELSADEDVRAVTADLAAFNADAETLVASFPTDEQPQARAGLYLDADGRPRTSYKRLRSV